MRNGLVILDGVDYNIGIKDIKRNFEVADSDSSGRTADWNMHRDVVGTFYNYTIEVFVQGGDYDAYNRFYEAISAPVASHTLTVPYGSGTMTFQAYITKGSDSLLHKSRRTRSNLWNGFSADFIAMEPQRRA